MAADRDSMPFSVAHTSSRLKFRSYIRDIGKGVTLQMYDRRGDADNVTLGIYLRPNIARKHRELIDALLAWAKEG
jgi:hypothetical protein